jgi:hypothetical protein
MMKRIGRISTADIKVLIKNEILSSIVQYTTENSFLKWLFVGIITHPSKDICGLKLFIAPL